MSMTRFRFDISGGSSAFTDTGPPVYGALVQMRWYPTTPDTGAALMLEQVPNIQDTGQNWAFYNDEDCLGAAFTKVPTQPQHHADGFDTGASSDVPIVFAGERIKATVTPGGSAVAGKLYLWFLD